MLVIIIVIYKATLIPIKNCLGAYLPLSHPQHSVILFYNVE